MKQSINSAILCKLLDAGGLESPQNDIAPSPPVYARANPATR
jgi:hypothetical protein